MERIFDHDTEGAERTWERLQVTRFDVLVHCVRQDLERVPRCFGDLDGFVLESYFIVLYRNLREIERRAPEVMERYLLTGVL